MDRGKHAAQPRDAPSSKVIPDFRQYFHQPMRARQPCDAAANDDNMARCRFVHDCPKSRIASAEKLE